MRDGGAGVVVTLGDPEDPTVAGTLMKKGNAITCSFNEGETAMDTALMWAAELHVESTRVATGTNSQALGEALLGLGSDIAELRQIR